MYKIPIRLEGNCRAAAPHMKSVRGPAATAKDFQPDINVISDEEAAMTTLQETIRRKASKGDKAVNHMNDDEIDAKQQEVRNYLAIKANKERANNFVKHQRIDRAVDHRIQQKI
jgi:hypothetical protein